MNIDILLGKTTEHLIPLVGTKYQVHKNMLPDFLRLQRDALKDGFDLQIASAFRDFDRQLKIWNSKARGEKPLFDDKENPLDFNKLSPKEVMFAILRWSAIPGSSRHHWGTDVDVFDRNTQTEESVKLTTSECVGDGPAKALHDWLDLKMSQNEAYGFYRCYNTDRGGVSPERWHLSYYPVSRRLSEFYTFSLFKRNVESSEILFKKEILENADEIFHRYFLNLDIP